MERKRVQQKPEGESLTQQSFGESADINNMMARHLKSPNRLNRLGFIPQTPREPRFVDISSADSYHDMLNKVSAIDTKFMSLPAKLRQRFRNNPELMLRFVEDPANVREAVKLGLIADPDTVAEVREAEAEEARRRAEQVDLVDESKKTAPAPSKPPEGGQKPA